MYRYISLSLRVKSRRATKDGDRRGTFGVYNSGQRRPLVVVARVKRYIQQLSRKHDQTS